jgi:hypothetical protein
LITRRRSQPDYNPPVLRLCNRYTSSTAAIVWVASPASRAPVLQAIEELARTSIEQVLKLLDGDDRFQSQTQYRTMWGSEDSKTGGWTSTRAYKQVAKAKLDLNKTRIFSVVAKEYMTGEDDQTGAGVTLPTLGHVPNRLNLIHGPLGQNTVAHHPRQKDHRSIIC